MDASPGKPNYLKRSPFVSGGGGGVGNSRIPFVWTTSCYLSAFYPASQTLGLSFQFPYVTPAPHEPVKTLRSLVNIRKDSLRLVRYFKPNCGGWKFFWLLGLTGFMIQFLPGLPIGLFFPLHRNSLATFFILCQ